MKDLMEMSKDLSPEDLAQVSGGANDGIDPNLSKAKEAILSAFRVAKGLGIYRSEIIEDQLRDTYQMLYGISMDIQEAINKLMITLNIIQIHPMMDKNRKSMKNYIYIAIEALTKL